MTGRYWRGIEMRFHMIGLALMAGVAAPSLAQSDAQSNGRIERRIEKLERDLAAYRRGVVQPEIQAQAPATETIGVPATSGLADVTARLDALERQLARITGAAEENAHRLRQAQSAIEELRAATDARFAALETANSPAAEPEPQAAAAEPAAPAGGPEVQTAASEPATGDPAEDAYLVGFRQWEKGELAAAQKSLEAAAKKYPRHRRASYALNLAGRAYLDDGKPIPAAKLLLSNYQTNPKGERAADSLFFLGQALTKLGKAAEACKAYDELAEVYPTMRDWLKQRLPSARQEAKCS